MSEKLIIGKPQYECPFCGIEWYEYDLFHLEIEGCPSCRAKINLEEFLHEDEPLYTNWREKCYFRMKRQKDITDETVQFLQTNDKLGL